MVRDVFEDAYNYMKSGQLMRQVVNKINEVDFNNLAERQHFGDIYEQILNDLQSAGNAGEYYTPRAVTAFMVDRIDPQPGEILFDPACGTGGFLTCAIRHMREELRPKRPKQRETMQGALRAVEKKQLPHMLCVTNMLLHGIEDPSFVRHDNTLARPYISYGQGRPRRYRAHQSALRRARGRRHREQLSRALPHPGDRRPVPRPDRAPAEAGRPRRRGAARRHAVRRGRQDAAQGTSDGGVQPPHHRPPAQRVFKPYASIGTNLLFFEKGAPTKDIWFYEHRVPEGQKAYSMTKPIRLEHLQGCIDWWGGKERKGREETPQAWRVTAEEVKARGYNLDIKNPHAVADDHGDPETLLADLAARRGRDGGLARPVEGDPRRGAGPMNAERLLAHYERIADAPDAIARLRRFILDLAVRGKLVPQDANDEPASELLKRIAKEKARLVKAGADQSAEPRISTVDEAPC